MYNYSKNSSVVNFTIHRFPNDEIFSYYFDNRKSFGHLKIDLEINHKMNEGTYYLEMNDNILKDDMTLKDNGVTNDVTINAVDNDYIKIKLKVKDSKNNVEILQKYVLKSDFKIIGSDDNKIIKVCNNNL